MQKVVVEITGTTPLLMNNPAKMRAATPGGKKPTAPDPAVEAAEGRYLMPDQKTLCLKSDHLHRCFILASSGYRIAGRRSVVPYIAGSIDIQPDLISLNTSAYIVDSRRVVIKSGMGGGGGGIIRSRPLVWPWNAAFELYYDEEVFTPDFLQKVLCEQICKHAGKALGLLDYRPGKGGKFGRFNVTKWVQ